VGGNIVLGAFVTFALFVLGLFVLGLLLRYGVWWGGGGTPIVLTTEDALRAQSEAGFEVYWVGLEFEGLPLNSAAHFDTTIPRTGERIRRVGMGYLKEFPKLRFGDEGFAAPLSVTTYPYCDYHSPVQTELSHQFSVRGAIGFAETSRVLVHTANLLVEIHAASPGRARRAAEAMVPVSAATDVPPGQPLPAPIEVEC